MGLTMSERAAVTKAKAQAYARADVGLGAEAVTQTYDILNTCHFSAHTQRADLMADSKCAIGLLNPLIKSLTRSGKTPVLLKGAKATLDALALFTVAADTMTTMLDVASRGCPGSRGYANVGITTIMESPRLCRVQHRTACPATASDPEARHNRLTR
jgi:hypothetical protein